MVIGVDRLSRPQVVKQLWAYIKDNDLQNPANKREILCDGNLRAVFNADKVDMFKMNKVLGQYVFIIIIIMIVSPLSLSTPPRHLHDDY